VRPHGVISVFVEGASLTDVSPSFEDGQQYLLFLSHLTKDTERFAGVAIHHDSPSPWDERFNPTSHYFIVGDSAGIVHLTDDNIKLIDQVRTAVVTARR
jgi:hypothetical protein